MNDENNIFITPAVTEAEKGLRLDKFLSEMDALSLSRNRVQQLIKGGFVSADETEISDPAFKIRVGDVFCLEIPPAQEANPEPEDISLDVVYEDSDLIVVNKPAGMTVHPAPGAWHKTLVNALLFHCQDNLSGIGGVKRPGIVHRIDKETSGLIVAAKNDAAHQGLCAQFFNHSIDRTYNAVVYGVPNPLSGTVEGNIGRSKFDRKKMAILQNGGKFARTHYETVEVFARFAALVKCKLETGRTHQIRVHLSSLGHALIGDKVYKQNHISTLGLPPSLAPYLKAFPRQALHAATLGFVHPRTGQKLFFEAPFPPDFKDLIEKLHNI